MTFGKGDYLSSCYLE